jgi:hypothetical protein
MYVAVSLPKSATYLRDNQSQRETARLLPAEQLISFFPMTFIE